MKLLSKQDIDLAKARERKMEIDEGKKLAERVDTLRRVLPAEMARLEEFRDKTVAAVKADIEQILERKNRLSKEADAEEERRARAMEPLTERERELDRREEAIKAGEAENKKQADQVTADRIALLGEESRLQARIEDIGKRDAESKCMNDEAQITSKNARKALREAAFERDTAKKEREQSIDELKRREAAVAVREREAALKDESFARRERDLSLRSRAIIDREEEVSRELRRIIQK